MKGKVKWFNQKKGYGFIESFEDQEEYFVHVSSLSNVADLRKDDLVEFTPKESAKGLIAKDVNIVYD